VSPGCAIEWTCSLIPTQSECCEEAIIAMVPSQSMVPPTTNATSHYSFTLTTSEAVMICPPCCLPLIKTILLHPTTSKLHRLVITSPTDRMSSCLSSHESVGFFTTLP
jgi:hypothetical protein